MPDIVSDPGLILPASAGEYIVVPMKELLEIIADPRVAHHYVIREVAIDHIHGSVYFRVEPKQ